MKANTRGLHAMNPNNFVAILGWIGCEYKPAGVTEDGLDWVKPYLEEGGG